MAILQALLLWLSQRAGQLLNTLFGWATQLLFGKVTRDKQLFISGMALGSILWLISVIGIAFPSVGSILLVLVPLPRWVEKDWVRLIMAVLALIIPVLIGWLGLQAMPPEKRPGALSQKMRIVLRGFPYAVGLAVTLLLMLLFAPFLMLPRIARRWATQHVPLIVASKNYERVLEDIEKILEQDGWETQRQPASAMIRLPTRILVTLAGALVDRFVADRLTTLRAKNLEVTLHPADLVISGPPFDVARVRALLSENLAFSDVNQTWTKEANTIEDAAKKLWQGVITGSLEPAVARRKLQRLAQKQNHLDLEFEEWEVLERQQLLLERVLLDSRDESPGWLPHRLPITAEKSELLIGACAMGGLLLLGLLAQRRSHT